MKTTSTLKSSDLPKTYAGLMALHVPRPIHDSVSYENAVEVVHALAGFKLSPLTTISGPLVIATCTEFASLILARYLEERRRGLSPKEASDTASARTGKAFVTSALTTVGGFAVLMFSSLPLLRDFGAIVALNVAVALLAALVVQPPVLVWMDARGWLLKAGDRSPDAEPSPTGV